ncbi:putative alpha/beta superfamily hydrolase [Paenibacillus forsythiae]|uniref:Alpha/beta superfamily hydrolase n=1 Tax=Paenibacillus forsythiae TaxID=365616 RepID=A0ABU3H6H9_9BACL|nr:alpha/beta hydrolase-fold protein [Paenibacillus forsythiae]MDT3426427.1 putative alpha/beta superfamily hydrolase [Paenibacillus forsythiae]
MHSKLAHSKHIHSLELDGRRLTVYLPPSYPLSSRRYPVVYAHDGGDLMAICHSYMERLFREGLLAELIVVGMKTSCRTDEYTPWPAARLEAEAPAFGGRGCAYIDEVADSVKPYIDSLYRTLSEPGCTGMIGGSLGGLVTLLAAYRRPDAFGRFGLLSPSVWYEGFLEFAAGRPLPDAGLRLYVSVGNREGLYKRNKQREAVASTLELCRMWEATGVLDGQLHLEVEDGATHGLLAMANQFPKALQWLYGPCRDGETEPEKSQISPRYTVPGTEVFDLRSGRTGLDYRIFVHIPVKPAPDAGYPVLYTVDGNAYFGSFAEAMRLQTRHPRGLPSGMIVSIGYPSDEPFVSERRFLDLTVPAMQEDLRPDGTAWPCNGGTEHFLAFIEHELMPEIRRRYRVDGSKQALFGHSLGGFFTLYTLITRPSLFQTYIAGSPSFWWKDRVLFDLLPGLEEHLREGGTEVSLMIGIGTDEKESMLEDARLFMERLKPCKGKSLKRLQRIIFEGEGHVSVLHSMISPMLRFVFAEDGAALCI